MIQVVTTVEMSHEEQSADIMFKISKAKEKAMMKLTSRLQKLIRLKMISKIDHLTNIDERSSRFKKCNPLAETEADRRGQANVAIAGRSRVSGFVDV